MLVPRVLYSCFHGMGTPINYGSLDYHHMARLMEPKEELHVPRLISSHTTLVNKLCPSRLCRLSKFHAGIYINAWGNECSPGS
jgi:hypothetical protein